MKHAYLIIVHSEFEVLSRLLQAIDDERNDIYIHFDRKLKDYPDISTRNAGLFILTERIDVRWGDSSLVQAEYALFEAAYARAEYSYYHLLSGVDMPLKSQDFIHDFFSLNAGKEFIGYYQGEVEAEIEVRVKRFHLFPRHFSKNTDWKLFVLRVLRSAFLRFQKLFKIQRNKSVIFKKGTQWVSVTHAFVGYLLQQKIEVYKTYHHTFCSDEIFVQTICWNSPFRGHLYNATDEGKGCVRKIGWKNNQLLDWEMKDYDGLMKSEALFARKFTGKHLDVVDRILHQVLS